MDELSFGPSREASLPARLPSRRLRALVAAVSATGVVAAGVAYAVTAKNAHHAVTSQPAVTQSAVALPDPARLLPPPAGCKPTQADWPSLTGLPAGARPGAMRVIVDAQFSGRCPVP
jgi:hypothetical protein